MIALGHFEEAGDFQTDSPEIHSAPSAAKVFRERSKDFVNLSLYEQRLSRAQREAFSQLGDLQTDVRLPAACFMAREDLLKTYEEFVEFRAEKLAEQLNDLCLGERR